jgi:hypothetical protein
MINQKSILYFTANWCGRKYEVEVVIASRTRARPRLSLEEHISKLIFGYFSGKVTRVKIHPNVGFPN